MWQPDSLFTDELYHFGILGMKWGVRRTPEQLGHKTSRADKKKAKKEAKRQAAEEKQKAAEEAFNNYMSNAKKNYPDIYKTAVENAKFLADEAGFNWDDFTKEEQDYEIYLELTEIMPARHSNQNGSELYHYGVLGMKWGVRRTPEQLGHKVARDEAKAKYKSAKQDYKNATKAASDKYNSGDVKGYIKATQPSYDKMKAAKKDYEDVKKSQRRSNNQKISNELSKMSDQELKERVNRLNMERQYKSLRKDEIEFGKSEARRFLEKAGMQALTNTTAGYMQKGLNSAVTKGADMAWNGSAEVVGAMMDRDFRKRR